MNSQYELLSGHGKLFRFEHGKRKRWIGTVLLCAFLALTGSFLLHWISPRLQRDLILNRKEKLASMYGMGRFGGRHWLDHIMSLDDDVGLGVECERTC